MLRTASVSLARLRGLARVLPTGWPLTEDDTNFVIRVGCQGAPAELVIRLAALLAKLQWGSTTGAARCRLTSAYILDAWSEAGPVLVSVPTAMFTMLLHR